MRPIHQGEYETRSIGKPADWNEEKLGPCGALSVHDWTDERGLNHMISQWEFEENDLEKLQAGARIHLSVIGEVHPEVQVYVGDIPEASSEPTPAELCNG